MQKFKIKKEIKYINLILFVLLYCIISAFHEPWFDEAQAWEIAKCASIKKILFELPHYEGHPPLWWLILAIPAKLGIPFEFGLKMIGLLISTSSVVLLLFKSKLPYIVRLTLPFTYFFFYQYGIIVRPYGLMLLCLLMLGMNLPERKTHPWRVFTLLALLCLTSAYGILLAGGISICIIWETMNEKGIYATFRELLCDVHTRTLFLLLIIAVFLIFEIAPRSDTWVTSANATNSFWVCLLCTLFTLPGECFFTFGSWFSADRTLLQLVNIPRTELISFCIIGIILWMLIISMSSKKNLKFLVVPYVLFAFFAAKVYFSAHHLGIVFILFLFWGELLSRDNKRFEIGCSFLKHLKASSKDKILIQKGYRLIGLVCIVIPVIWNVCALANDLRLDYSYGRKTAAFLKDHSLEDALIFSKWNSSGSLCSASLGDEDYINTYSVGVPVEINAYFSKNICYNLNLGRDSQAYTYYKMANYQEYQETIKKWKDIGIPEVILGNPELSLIYGEQISYDNYSLVAVFEMNYTWKTSVQSGILPVYVRNDLLESHNLKPLEDEKYNLMFNGIYLSDEMKELYESGTPMEDVLKPYLDLLFGSIE